ncbi:MAG: hypothetical protein ACOC3V_00025 [bacterium]
MSNNIENLNNVIIEGIVKKNPKITNGRMHFPICHTYFDTEGNIDKYLLTIVLSDKINKEVIPYIQEDKTVRVIGKLIHRNGIYTYILAQDVEIKYQKYDSKGRVV